jgi:DNA-directed RNA polymerase alpha subunit
VQGPYTSVTVPAISAAFLRRLAKFLREDRAGVPASVIERILRRAAEMQAVTAKPLTANSPIEDMEAHGISLAVINTLKREGMDTIGELCDRDADLLLDIRTINRGRIRELSAVLARFDMGLRPVRR